MPELLNPANYSLNLNSIPVGVAAAIDLILGIYILKKGKGKIQFIAYFMGLLAIFIWLFSFSTLLSLTSLPLVSKAWASVGFLGSVLIGPGAYFIAVAISCEVSTKWLKILTSYLIGLSFYVIEQAFPGTMIGEAREFFFGPNSTGGPYEPLFFIFHLFMIAMAFKTVLQIPKEKLKGNLRTLRNMFIFSLIVGTFANSDFLIDLGIEVYPVGYISITFFLFVVGYGLIKYNLFEITPSLLSENIIMNMSDYLIAFDKDFKIELASESLYKAFKANKSDFVGQDVSLLFGKEKKTLITQFAENRKISNLKANIKFNKKSMPVFISGNIYESEDGKILGYALIMKDLSKIQNLINDLETKSAELEAKSEELQKKNKELERYNQLMVNRELKMIELKENIKKMKGKAAD